MDAFTGKETTWEKVTYVVGDLIDLMMLIPSNVRVPLIGCMIIAVYPPVSWCLRQAWHLVSTF